MYTEGSPMFKTACAMQNIGACKILFFIIYQEKGKVHNSFFYTLKVVVSHGLGDNMTQHVCCIRVSYAPFTKAFNFCRRLFFFFHFRYLYWIVMMSFNSIDFGRFLPPQYKKRHRWYNVEHYEFGQKSKRISSVL